MYIPCWAVIVVVYLLQKRRKKKVTCPSMITLVSYNGSFNNMMVSRVYTVSSTPEERKKRRLMLYASSHVLCCPMCMTLPSVTPKCCASFLIIVGPDMISAYTKFIKHADCAFLHFRMGPFLLDSLQKNRQNPTDVSFRLLCPNAQPLSDPISSCVRLFLTWCLG